MNRLIFAVAILLSVATHATDLPDKPKFLPVDARNAMWVFSGQVTSEDGGNYGYFFELKREDQHFHVTAALIDAVTKKILVQEERDAIMPSASPYDWHVGDAFLTFNSINDSWIFGVTPKNKPGFNFKVDMLKQFEHQPKYHHLRQGMGMLVMKTSELNGNVSHLKKEQFVHADHAWFRQIWQSNSDNKTHSLSSALCQFDNGSCFYAVSLHESDAKSGAIAAWFDEKGKERAMSQFVKISQKKDKNWHIESPFPRIDLALSTALQHNAVIAGFVDGQKYPGFCMLDH